MQAKKAFITGIGGQDGSYLTELLLSKGYVVHGLVRRSSSDNLRRIQHLLSTVHVHEGDITDAALMMRLISQIQPDEIYNLAGQSDVGLSFETPSYTTQVNALGCLNMIEAARLANNARNTEQGTIRFYQASTSEIFGSSPDFPQSENTPMRPVSPYGCSKAYAHQTTTSYRRAYGMYAVNGILFNHESPRRGERFVTTKIAHAAALAAIGRARILKLGNINAMRDWGHSRDYVEAMWRMLQLDEPQDFVIGTGVTHTVQDMVRMVYDMAGIDIEWIGEGVEMRGICAKTGKIHIAVSSSLFRPVEPTKMQADITRAKTILHWQPKTDLKSIMREMFQAELLSMKDKIRTEQIRRVSSF